MKERLLRTLGVAIGLFGYKLFFYGVNYDPQVFFNSAILAMNGLILVRLNCDPDKKYKKWNDFIIMIIAGVVLSYFIKSHN